MLSQKQYYLYKKATGNLYVRKVINHYKNSVMNENLLFLRKIFPNSRILRDILTDLPEMDGIKKNLPNKMSYKELGITQEEIYNLLVQRKLINYGDLREM